MRIRVKVFVLGLIFVCWGAMGTYAQQKTDSNNTSNTSLGDLARQLKAQKAKEPKPAMVITNDNIPTAKGGAEFSSGAAPKTSVGSAAEGTGAAGEVHDEKYYRSQMSKLQERLDTDKRELDVLEQKLGQNQAQYYSDPTKSLMQQYSRGDINKLTDEINTKKQKVADDEKAIDNLRDQLRHEGGDPSWLR